MKNKINRPIIRSQAGSIRSQSGQGLVEYLIIVALMAVATIGIMRVLGQTVSAKFASATHALQGRKKAVAVESVDESLHSKKDLSNFFNGAGNQNSGGGNDQ